MLKRDKRLLFILCIITSVLISVIVTNIVIRYQYGNKITEIYESIQRINKIIVEEYFDDKTTRD